MTKTVFVFSVLILLTAATVWFFLDKNNRVKTQSLIPSPSVSTTPASSGASAGEMIKLGNGLQYQDLIVGTGVTARSGVIVAVHYTGTLMDGTKFDSSLDRGQPFAFALGAGQVIQGWDIGVVGMNVGGKRKLIIPPQLAYGERGAGDVIPPNSTLVFEVELLDLQAVQAQ